MKSLLIIFLVFSGITFGQESSQSKFDQLTEEISAREGLSLDSIYLLLQEQKLLATQNKNNGQIAENAYQFAKYWDNDLDKSDSAYLYLLRAKKFFQKAKNRKDVAKSLLFISDLHHKNAKDDRAEKASNEVLKIAKSINDDELIGKVYFSRSKVFFGKEDHAEALRNAQIAQKYWKKLDSEKQKTFYPKGIIAIIYLAQGQSDKAKNPLKEAVEFSAKSKEYLGAFQYSLRLAQCYMEDDNKDEVINYLKRGISYAETANHPWSIGLGNAFLISTYLSYDELDSANYYNRKLKESKLNLESPYIKARLVKNDGILAYKLKDFKTAIVHYKKARSIYFDELGSEYEYSTITLNLHESYLNLHDYKNAFKYYSEYIDYRDSINSREKIEELKEVQLNYEFQQERVSDSLLQIQQAQTIQISHEKELGREKRNTYFLFFGIIIAVLVSGFSFIAFRRKKAQTHLLNEKNVEIAKNLNEKQLLLKEIHHRVKNNFQIVSSLLELQTKGIDDEKALELVIEGQNRVRSMALIHQELYQNEDLLLNIENYIHKLFREIHAIYSSSEVKSSISVDTELTLDIDTAIPLGLILNELLTNSFKYGFSADAENELKIQLIKNENEYELLLADSGKGIPSSIDLSKAKSIGLRLVRRLSKQLQGRMEYSNENASEFRIFFKDTSMRMEAD